MKKVVALLFCVVGIAIVALGLPRDSGKSESDFLRLHIRANSNSVADQSIKFDVRQEIINELTPIFVNVTSRRAAMDALNNNLSRVTAAANRALVAGGFDYRATASMRTEFFPTRHYNSLTLPEGVYDALIVNLGAGAGDNWWSVVYPPLCFLDNNIGGDRGVVYRSKLRQIIRRYM